jgi:hypothetical protein
MCTVTFIPRSKGYCLGMNRDEKRSRAKGLPPAIRDVHGRRVLYPSEPTGGTWISLNDNGVTFALINWYSVPSRPGGNFMSRGTVIPSLSAADSPAQVDTGLAAIPLHLMNPFRLIGVFPTSKTVVEWRWNLKKLIRKRHRWRAQQWISSGFEEPTAQKVRSKTFMQAQTQRSAGTFDWLRRLHRSHWPQAGPFSTCVHRDDAATVSYTEINVLRRCYRMHHICEAPCSCIASEVHLSCMTPYDRPASQKGVFVSQWSKSESCASC